MLSLDSDRRAPIPYVILLLVATMSCVSNASPAATYLSHVKNSYTVTAEFDLITLLHMQIRGLHRANAACCRISLSAIKPLTTCQGKKLGWFSTEYLLPPLIRPCTRQDRKHHAASYRHAIYHNSPMIHQAHVRSFLFPRALEETLGGRM